jgi:thymidylate synthase
MRRLFITYHYTMRQYLDVLKDIYENGTDVEGRNGSTRKLFTQQMRFNLEEGFPAVTTKRLAFKQVVAELLWFIKGSSDNNELNAMGCHIWDANANADYWKPKAKFEGDLGRVYGVQWRHWRKPDGTEVDQLADVIERIKKDPNDRRLIVSAWNPGELDMMALPPCHMIFQFYVANGKLSLHMFQRSCDMFLGVPFNIASYALLLSMVAKETGLTPHECVLTLGDAHIYHDHFSAVEEQLTRTPHKLPILWLNPDVKDIWSYTPDDIKLENYEHDETIKAPMAV